MKPGFRAGRLAAVLSACAALSAAGAADPRLREVVYDPQTVVTVPVRRGIVTLVVLDPDEAITEVAAGLGGDCTRPESAWCIVAQAGGRTLFVKAKRAARAANNLAVVTDRRAHAFRFVVLADSDPGPSVHRLQVSAAAPATPRAAEKEVAAQLPVIPDPLPRPADIVAERLQARPEVVNAHYTVAEGRGSGAIVPTLVYDDGRFTYLRFPGNREVPVVYQVLDDGGEALVNTRMEDELLVVDRVCPHLMLRSGSAVVGLWNEAFDLEGVPPVDGTTVPGLRRVLRPAGGSAP